MIHASSGTGYSTSPKGKSRKQPPAPLLSPTLTSTPTTPDVGDERAIATVVGGNEVMNQQNSSTNLSGLASPAKAGSGMSYISSSAQQPNRASIRPSRQSPSTSSVQSRFSLYNRAVPESARAIYGASPSSVSQTYSAGSSSLPSRHLITVIPPNTLPHDPPHPRANPQASGYGTPENFKRGVLLPLYPTLSGQLGAIAREYGLPSKGGLIVYLLELSTEIVSDGPHQAFVGGPRISEEAWSLLWSRLFELESLSREPGMGLSDENALEFSENEEDEQPASNLSNSHAPRSSRPPVPPVPQQHRLARAPEERYSDESSRASIADGSEEHSPEPYSATTDSTSQSITSPTSKQYNHQRQSATAGPPRSPPVSQSRPASRASKRPPTSQSMRSLRRHTATSVASLAAYEPSVIVGKLEFDIDRRRGAGRWYEAWIEQAEHAHALPPPSVTASSPAAFPPSSFNSPAYTTAFASPADTQRRGSAPNTAEFHSPYANQAHQQARGPGKAELYLPNFVNRKSQQPLSSSRSVSPSSSTQPTLQSLAREERGSLNISIDDSRAGQTATSAPHLPHGQEEDTSAFRQQQGYTQLTDEEESRYGGDTDADTTSQPSFAPESNPRTSHQGSDRSRKSSDQPSNDPLSDVFGSEETTWKTLATAGLGLGTMPDALAVKLSSEADENVESPIDDVRDIKELLKRRSEDTTKKQRSNVQLSSPIHLDQAQFSGPSVNSPSQFETSMAHTESIVVTSSTPPSASTVTRGSPADQQDLVTSNQSVVTAVPEQSGQSDGFVPPPVPSSWNSFAALHEDPATPSAPINDTTKRESFDVDFDNLEKALAELSPQAMKRKGATPSKGSSSRPSGPSSATSPISPRAVTSTSEQLNALERASSQASTNSVQTTATTGSRDAASQSSAQSPKNGTSRVTSIQTDASSVVARVLATESSPPLPKVPEVEDADDRSAPQAAETSRIQFLDQAQPRSGDSTSFSAGSTSKLTGGQGAGEESQHAPRHSDAEPQVSPDPARPLAAAPISTSSTSTEPATVTPTNTGFQGAPTTFDSILAEQNRKPSESHPPRGSSLQHSLRRPWAARSPNHTTSPQPSQSSKEEGSSTGFMKIFRKNTSASNSDAQEQATSKVLSPGVASKLQSPRDRGVPMFENPPNHSSSLAQRRRGFASPPTSPHPPAHNDEPPSSQNDFAAQARAYFNSNSSDPLSGLRESPSPSAHQEEFLR